MKSRAPLLSVIIISIVTGQTIQVRELEMANEQSRDIIINIGNLSLLSINLISYLDETYISPFGFKMVLIDLMSFEDDILFTIATSGTQIRSVGGKL